MGHDETCADFIERIVYFLDNELDHNHVALDYLTQ